MNTKRATRIGQIRLSRCRLFNRSPLRKRHVGCCARNGWFSTVSLFLIVVLMFAPPASAVDYSTTYYDGSTDYDVYHWSKWYWSGGGEASATPLVQNEICGYKHAYHTNGHLPIKCRKAESWSNRIQYPRQMARNVCVIRDLSWGGYGISLACYKGS